MKNLLAVTCLALLGAGAVRAEDFDRRFTIAGDRLLVVNLAGEIKVEPATGSSFEVEAAARGKDATADLVRFAQEDGADAHLCVQLPLEKEKSFVYPSLGRFSSSEFTAPRGASWGESPGSGGSSWGKGRKVHLKGGGGGVEVWVDLVVRVPAGKKLEVRQGGGRVSATDVQADLVLTTNVGPVAVEGTRGPVSIDTGSGEVSAKNTNGDLSVDTGSGDVVLENCRGGVVTVDTGSGAVEAAGVEADDVEIDTGSGDVTLALTRMGRGSFLIDTGSGDIDLRLPADASAEIEADTGNGDITLDLAASKIKRHSDDEMSVTIGTGEAKVTLDTGSGAIVIRSVHP